ncbi:MAG: sigma-70 family RNA polymerase sigma factor [SAR202 cluster bacterium]|nr:sigma-70 family RNA polymerase sigma factor [SAR202 cluster bacterium]
MLLENQDDEEKALILSAQRGDRDAFAQLYEANVERVYRYLLSRLHEPADAEDVTAEVFIQAMKALPSYKARGTPFIAWLFRIAHNQAINYMKKQARRQETPLLETAATHDGPDEEVIDRIRFGEVVDAMGALTDLQRHVLSLRFAGELSIAEVASVMKRKEGAVKFLQFSALRALRRAWSQQEAGSHEN